MIQGFKSLSMNQLWHCLAIENEYTDIIRADRGFLNKAMDDMKASESGGLCDMAQTYSGDSNMTLALCHSIQNDVFSKGMSLVHQDFIKSALIILLDYFSRVNDFNANATLDNGAAQTQFILDKLH